MRLDQSPSLDFSLGDSSVSLRAVKNFYLYAMLEKIVWYITFQLPNLCLCFRTIFSFAVIKDRFHCPKKHE